MLKPKIAIIGLKGLPAFGGAARATEEIVKQLKSEFDFTIYTVDTHSSAQFPYPEIKQVLFKGCAYKRINTLLYYFKSTLHALFKGNYELVHLQHLYSGFLLPLLKIRYKVISTVRGIIPDKDNKWNKLDIVFFRLFERLSLFFSDVVVSVAKPHINYLKRFTNKEIIYIPNGINIIDSEIHSSTNRQNFILFSAARIISLKGCHILFEALNTIDYKNTVNIIGSINHVPKYGKYLKELSKNLEVNFLGLIKEKGKLLDYMAKSKLFIFPSFNEGMSNILLEVASVKTPIVASDIVENKAIFNNSEVLFFRTGDSADLAQKILWALDNESKMYAKAEKAYEKLRLNHQWKDIAKEYDRLYRILL